MILSQYRNLKGFKDRRSPSSLSQMIPLPSPNMGMNRSKMLQFKRSRNLSRSLRMKNLTLSLIRLRRQTVETVETIEEVKARLPAFHIPIS